MYIIWQSCDSMDACYLPPASCCLRLATYNTKRRARWGANHLSYASSAMVVPSLHQVTVSALSHCNNSVLRHSFMSAQPPCFHVLVYNPFKRFCSSFSFLYLYLETFPGVRSGRPEGVAGALGGARWGALRARWEHIGAR